MERDDRQVQGDRRPETERGLPAFIFQATFDETESKNGKVGRWRKQAATRLTGLVVMDIDHVEDPHAVYDSWLKVHDLKALGIELVYITPSGKGLKVVFKANVEYNLIDNQHAMAKVLGVEVDEACKDASRMSFICKEEDILFIDKELFTYENKEYGERFDALYRDGRSQGSVEHKENPSKNLEEEITLEKNEEGEYCYHGVKFREICEAWQASQGGAPVPGDRHRTMLQMALDLRYITDNRPENIVCVLKLCRFVQDIIREREKRKSGALLIRLVIGDSTATSQRGCKRCLKVLVYHPATARQMEELWQSLKSRTSCSQSAWNLSLAPLIVTPVEP